MTNIRSSPSVTALRVDVRGCSVVPMCGRSSCGLEDLAAEGDPIAALVEDSILTRSQVDAALRYRAAYPDEIAAHIELHRRETAAADTP